MDTIDLLNSNICELPRKSEDLSYGASLRNSIEDYCNGIAALNGTDYATTALRGNIATIRTLGQHLLAVLDQTLNGQPGLAREEMFEAMQLVAPQLQILKSNPLDGNSIGRLFRARPASLDENVDRGGLFHIPFSKRYLVGPQRYSMQGVPMLYLGSSLYVCWEELGRKNLESLWISSFQLAPSNSVTILDLGYRPALAATILDQHNSQGNGFTELAIAQAILWPLSAACSYVRKNPSDPFVEEYIIPQNVTSYIVETGEFDGIRYFSNRVSSYEGEFLCMNYVFPAHQVADEDYSPSLKEKFIFTDPLPYSMVRILNPTNITPARSSRGGTGTIEPFSGHRTDYAQTELSQVEAKLLNMEHRHL